MGGTALALAPRLAGLARYMGAPLDEAHILRELRRACWWDTALSAGPGPLAAAEAWGVGARVVWGSDFPGQSPRVVRSIEIRD